MQNLYYVLKLLCVVVNGIVYLLKNSINPADKTKCFEEHVKFIEKPLSIQKIKEILGQTP